MIVRTPQGEYLSVDFREAAPAAAFEDMYAGNEDGSVRGGLSVGVPGEIRGFEWVHRRFGRLKWKSVFEPAVKMAREGFVGESEGEFPEFANISSLHGYFSNVADN